MLIFDVNNTCGIFYRNRRQHREDDAIADARREQRAAISLAGVPQVWGKSPDRIIE